MNDQELSAAIAAMPGEKVTEAYMRSRIKSRDFTKLGDTGTLCHVTLDNGFTVNGFSACVDPANFNLEIGFALAEKDAMRQLWPLFGFLLAEKRFRSAKVEG